MRCQIIPYIEKSTNLTLFDCKWVPCSTRCLITGTRYSKFGGQEGVIQLYDMSPKNENCFELKELSTGVSLKSASKANDGGVKCSTFEASSLQDRHLVTGNFDGSLNVWDVNSGAKCIRRIDAHSAIVNNVCGVNNTTGGGSFLACSASSDGSIKLWDIHRARSYSTPVVHIKPSVKSSYKNKVEAWSVAASGKHSNLLACGYDNGDLKLIDLRMPNVKLLQSKELTGGICSLTFENWNEVAGDDSPQHPDLLIGGMGGEFHMWNINGKSSENRQCSSKSADCESEGILNSYVFSQGSARKSNNRCNKESTTIWSTRYLRSSSTQKLFSVSTGSGILAIYRCSEKSESSSEKRMDTPEQLQCMRISDQPLCSVDWNDCKLGLALTVSFDQVVRVVLVTQLQ